jgi:hypothetical protein
MTQILPFGTPGSISSEEDLTLRGGLFNINPPPSDGKCKCCRRHLSELKPYGEVGDPLVGDFDGELLVKTWMPMGLPDENIDMLYDNYFGNCHTEEDYAKAKDVIARDLGEKEAERIIFSDQLSATTEAVWLCRDCIVLGLDEYFEKRFPEYYSKKSEPGSI